MTYQAKEAGGVKLTQVTTQSLGQSRSRNGDGDTINVDGIYLDMLIQAMLCQIAHKLDLADIACYNGGPKVKHQLKQLQSSIEYMHLCCMVLIYLDRN